MNRSTLTNNSAVPDCTSWNRDDDTKCESAKKLHQHWGTFTWHRCSLTRYTHADLFRRFNAGRLNGSHVTRPRTRIIGTGFQYRYPTIAKMNARTKISIILVSVGIGRHGNGNFASTRMPKPAILGRKIALTQNIHFRTLQPIHIFRFNLISCVLRFSAAAIDDCTHRDFHVRVFHGDANQAFPKAPIQCVRVRNGNAAFVLFESFSKISTIPTRRCAKINFNGHSCGSCLIYHLYFSMPWPGIKLNPISSIKRTNRQNLITLSVFISLHFIDICRGASSMSTEVFSSSAEQKEPANLYKFNSVKWKLWWAKTLPNVCIEATFTSKFNSLVRPSMPVITDHFPFASAASYNSGKIHFECCGGIVFGWSGRMT